MNEPLQISAKNLGDFHQPDACLRCLWIKLHYPGKLPFQIFPGIFSSIDSYTKKAVHGWIDEYGELPGWLAAVGLAGEYRAVPGHTRFRVLDEATNITLTGVPDDIFVREDGAHLIIDYKTARFTPNQDALLPVYHAQLNGYAHIAERTGFSPVGGLALVYMEPRTEQEDADAPENRRPDGFAMGFAAHILPIPQEPGLVPGLLAQARALFDQPRPPQGNPGCEECETLQELVGFVNGL